MRPSPVVLLALVAGGFALIAVPLARLTWAERSWGDGGATAAGGVVAVPMEATGRVPVVMRVRFAHAPMVVVVRQDDRLVAEFGLPDDGVSGQMERVGELRVVEGEPIDVLVTARWPAGTPVTALGLEVEPDGFETRRATVWAEGGEVEELMTFSWP